MGLGKDLLYFLNDWSLPIIDGAAVAVGDFAPSLIRSVTLSKYISSENIKIGRISLWSVDATPQRFSDFVFLP